jgi:tetratricopeptide (TPR) repeat protein
MGRWFGRYHGCRDCSRGGNYDESIRLFTKTIESGELSRENLSITYYNRGEAWYNKGDYHRAIEINPQYADAYYNRGNAWGNKGYYEKAKADRDKAKEINPSL